MSTSSAALPPDSAYRVPAATARIATTCGARVAAHAGDVFGCPRRWICARLCVRIVVVFGNFIQLIVFGNHDEPRILASPPSVTIRSQAHCGPFRGLFAGNGAAVRRFCRIGGFALFARCCHVIDR